MDRINDGGQAFPNPETGREIGTPGMTLRDYFAAQAMNAIMGLTMPDIGISKELLSKAMPEVCAKTSYVFADAMLAERERKS